MGGANAPVNRPNDDDLYDAVLKGLGSLSNPGDPKVRTAKNLYLVKTGQMHPKVFYQELASMKLGKPARFFLMDLRKDIENKGGMRAVDLFLGKAYTKKDPKTGKILPTGATEVESKILSWRRDFVNQGIDKILRQFAGQHRINSHEYKVFLADIGSWPFESPQEMKFAGDIDFNFVSGNYDLAWRMKLAFDQHVMSEIGMSAEHMDTVCTAHGMAEPEVYVGKHGASFGEDWMQHKSPPLTKADMRNGVRAEKVPAPQVLQEIAYDFKVAKGVPKLPPDRVPKEPGISMEMIRHFTHDIMHNPVYADMDAFLKAAKYTERSMDALRAFGMEPGNPQLEAMCKKLMTLKKMGAEEQTKVIREYYGGQLPILVELGPAVEGKSPVTIRANEALIKNFQLECQAALWDNIKRSFKHVLDDLKNRSNQVGDDPEALKRFREEFQLVRSMIEVEFLLFNDPKTGMPIDAEVVRMRDDLESSYKDFMQRRGLKMLDAKETAEYKFLEGLLKHGTDGDGKWKARIAMGALAKWSGLFLDKVNTYLDILDDRLMGPIRGQDPSWEEFIRSGQKEYARQAWHAWVDPYPPKEIKKTGYTAQGIMKQIEKLANERLTQNCLTRRVQRVNLILGEAMQSTAAGRATMKGIMAFGLATEIPAYVQAWSSGKDWQESMSKVGTEFFVRRVPFGSVVEHMYMGRYGLAAWDSVVNFVPPIALMQVAFNIGEGAGRRAWKLFWTEELKLLVDTFYDAATMEFIDTTRYSRALVLGNWRLRKIDYQGREYDIEEFTKTKRQQIDEMMDSLEQPHSIINFPDRYKHEGISGLVDVNEVLKETVAEGDNVLYMLEEMRKHPSVGEKLQVHLGDMWETRWEQVKLNFILNTCRELEARWQAEQAEKSGKYEETFEELMKHARELRIQDQIKEHLSDETGGVFYELVRWFVDLFKGIKREYMCQPDIWDYYEEATKVTIKYLKVYNQIHQARTEAEKVFTPRDRPVDRGLRILTTPVFLSGEADRDEIQYKAWRNLPDKSRQDWEQKLRDIKRECQPNSALEGPFDQRIMEKVLLHDVWWQLWKHANNVGARAGDDLWQELQGNFTPDEFPRSGQGAELASQFLSFDHEQRHKDKRDQYVEEFRDHYKKKCKYQDEAGRIGLCAQAESIAKQAEADLQAMADLRAETARLIADLKAKMALLGPALERVEKLDKTFTDKGESAFKLHKKLERQVKEVCTQAGKVIDADMEADFATLMSDLQEAVKQVRDTKDALKKLKPEMESLASQLESEFAPFKDLAANLATVTAQLVQIASKLAETQQALKVAHQLLAQARAPPEQPPAQDGQPAPPPPPPPPCVEQTETRLKVLDAQVAAQLQALESLQEEHNKAVADNQALSRLDKLRKTAEEGRSGLEVLDSILKQVGSLVKQTALCATKAMRAADLMAAKMLAKVREHIKGCGFKDAKPIIGRMPPGESKDQAVQEYREALAREKRTVALYQEAKALLAGEDYSGALAKLQEALANTRCDQYRRKIEAAIANINNRSFGDLLSKLAKRVAELKAVCGKVTSGAGRDHFRKAAQACSQAQSLYRQIQKSSAQVQKAAAKAANLIARAGPWPQAKKSLGKAGAQLDACARPQKELRKAQSRLEAYHTAYRKAASEARSLEQILQQEAQPKYAQVNELISQISGFISGGGAGTATDEVRAKLQAHGKAAKSYFNQAQKALKSVRDALQKCGSMSPSLDQIMQKARTQTQNAENALGQVGSTLGSRTSKLRRKLQENKKFLGEAPTLLAQLREKIEQNTKAKEARENALRKPNLAPTYAEKYKFELREIAKVLERDKKLEKKLAREIRDRREENKNIQPELAMLGSLNRKLNSR